MMRRLNKPMITVYVPVSLSSICSLSQHTVAGSGEKRKMLLCVLCTVERIDAIAIDMHFDFSTSFIDATGLRR